MKEIFAMALWAKWRADTGTVKDCLLPIRSELAKISAWTRAIDSQGELVLTFEPAQVVNFIEPLRCSALGALEGNRIALEAWASKATSRRLQALTGKPPSTAKSKSKSGAKRV